MASRFTIYSINQISDLINKISDVLYQIFYINKISYMSIKTSYIRATDNFECIWVFNPIKIYSIG